MTDLAIDTVYKGRGLVGWFRWYTIPPSGSHCWHCADPSVCERDCVLLWKAEIELAGQSRQTSKPRANLGTARPHG